jgi:hypothetical protein
MENSARTARRAGQKATCEGFCPTVDKNPESRLAASDWQGAAELAVFLRGKTGTYISVEPFHLFRYLDEPTWRYNNRATKENPMNDG